MFILEIFAVIIIIISICLLRFYKARKFKRHILKIIFVLQNIDIDLYYDEYFLKEVENGNHDIEDKYDELFGNTTQQYLNNVPSVLRLMFSIKPYNIENWMDIEFCHKYDLFIKYKLEFLYSKYKMKVYSAKMFLINKKLGE